MIGTTNIMITVFLSRKTSSNSFLIKVHNILVFICNPLSFNEFPENISQVLRPGPGFQLRRRSLAYDPALMDHDDPVA